MKLLTTLILLFSVQVSFAQEVSLKEVMESIGNQFKTIAIAVQKGEVKETDIDAMEDLQRLISQATQIYPNSAETVEQKLNYLELLNELMAKSLEIEDEAKLALTTSPQNLNTVKKLFAEINQIRQKGHEIFKVN